MERRERGGIHVELVVVICILSLIVGATRPMLQMDDEAVLDREAMVLVETLRYVQELSKTEHRRRPAMWPGFMFSRITLDVRTSDYMVKLQAPGRTSILKTHKMPEGMRIRFRDSAHFRTVILFLQNGDVPMGYMQTLTVTNGRAERRIIIDQAGRIRVEK